jgi:hypothetical protein
MPRTCWAASRGDCSRGKSGEHVLSKCALPEFLLTEGFLKIDPGKRISRGSLKANVLCKTHNEELSDLDSEVKKLSDALQEHLRSSSRRETRVKVDGRKIERWLLKCLYGAGASRWTVNDQAYPPDPALVKIAFGEGRLKSPAGLYVVKKPEPKRPSEVAMGGEVIHNLSDRQDVLGAHIQVRCLGFIISLIPEDPTLSLRAKATSRGGLDWSHAELAYRPESVTLAYRYKAWAANELARLTVEFAWG